MGSARSEAAPCPGLPGTISCHQQPGEGHGTDGTLETAEGNSTACQHLDFRLLTSCTWERIYFYCFKLSSLWNFVVAALGGCRVNNSSLKCWHFLGDSREKMAGFHTQLWVRSGGGGGDWLLPTWTEKQIL